MFKRVDFYVRNSFGSWLFAGFIIAALAVLLFL